MSLQRMGHVAALGVALALVSTPPSAAEPSPLRFSVTEGRTQNAFFRDGPVAAHLVLTGGAAPRLVVAFPAGNSGAAVWFEAPSGSAAFKQVTNVVAEERAVAGGTLRGVSAEIEATGAPLLIRHAILSSVRVIRDYGYTGRTPPDVRVAPQLADGALVWRRARLDGAPGYFLSIEPLRGSVAGGEGRPFELTPDRRGRLRLRITALTGDEPLTPIPESALLNDAAASDRRLRQMLAFLSYEEKLLAGSWRFDTYFGRDTLMALELLMDVLKPAPIEAGLGSVIERLSPAGEVAHEEEIGEYAILRHLREGGGAGAAPFHDYKMIDGAFLLPIVAAHYLAIPAGRARADAFLARRTSGGETYGAALVRNLRFVLSAAAPFARDPVWRNLISLKAGETVGNWRDTEDGLGGGRYPYDVNAVLVAAALDAVARLRESGVLKDHLAQEDEGAMAGAARMAAIWKDRAPPAFDVSVDPGVARSEVARYAQRIGVSPAAALGALGDDPVTFHAIALDAAGAPVPILHTDEGFALLFLDPTSEEIERALGALTRPFPAGLMTDVGAVVANPAYAGEALQQKFGRDRYAGSVITSWQQALLAAGIARQIGRGDLTAAARRSLIDARGRLKATMARTRGMRGAELWSWSWSDGRYAAAPFGQRKSDDTESNAAQLWSTVYLAGGE